MKTLKSTILITSALTAVAIACQGIAQTDPVTESIEGLILLSS
jgi:hypothetical protein